MMNKYLLSFLILFISVDSYSCNPPEHNLIPENCQGKSIPLFRSFSDVKTDLPDGIVTHTNDLISFKVIDNKTLYCLEKYIDQKWLKPFLLKKTNYYRSCQINIRVVCTPSRNHDVPKLDWDCNTELGTCGNPNHPTFYEIKTIEFQDSNAEALKELNKGKPFEKEFVRKFAYKGYVKFLKFKVRWTLNPNFSKDCEIYKYVEDK